VTDWLRRRALVAPVVFLLASEAIDLTCRPTAYLARIEYLVLRAGVLATGGVYVVSLGATLLVLVALFSIPRIGRWLVGSATALLFVVNMVFHVTLFQHAKRWGYRTVVLDGPGRNFPNIVIRPADLRQTVDVLMRGYEAGGAVRDYDLALADRARRLIEERSGNFIVLIKVGAHFHYETSYPGDEPRYARHLPKLRMHESYGASRERTINSYKNALGFTVDAFFERLLAKPLPNTTILYTSDHGQSLQEHGQTYTHCKDEIEQAVVPFTLYSDVPWVRAHAWAPGVVLSHHDLYPSLVSLLAREREVEHEGYRSLFSARRSQPRLTYFSGGIWANSRTIEVAPVDAIKFGGTGRAAAP